MVPQLTELQEELQSNKIPQPVTVRTFLWWFGAYRRGYAIVQHIREELAEAGIETTPDFDSVWLDAPINFRLAQPNSDEALGDGAATDAPASEVDVGTEASSTRNWINREATYRVGRLAAANLQVVSVPPDWTLAQAVTIMLARGFSQLPVMTSERDVKGMLSWQSIGTRLALGAPAERARDLMDSHHEIRSSSSIFDAIQLIAVNDYVLVRGADNRITGIVTASDLSLQFRELTEPFLLLSEIENLVRNMIGNHFASTELRTACDPGDSARAQTIETIADLTFGEYIRLLENPDRWATLGLAVDRVLFCEQLHRVREVRNDVMHFDPDGIEPPKLVRLREFTRFMRELANVSEHSA